MHRCVNWYVFACRGPGAAWALDPVWVHSVRCTKKYVSRSCAPATADIRAIEALHWPNTCRRARRIQPHPCTVGSAGKDGVGCAVLFGARLASVKLQSHVYPLWLAHRTSTHIFFRTSHTGDPLGPRPMQHQDPRTQTPTHRCTWHGSLPQRP